jgi:hypothetical protein
MASRPSKRPVSSALSTEVIFLFSPDRVNQAETYILFVFSVRMQIPEILSYSRMWPILLEIFLR